MGLLSSCSLLLLLWVLLWGFVLEEQLLVFLVYDHCLNFLRLPVAHRDCLHFLRLLELLLLPPLCCTSEAFATVVNMYV